MKIISDIELTSNRIDRLLDTLELSSNHISELVDLKLKLEAMKYKALAHSVPRKRKYDTIQDRKSVV